MLQAKPHSYAAKMSLIGRLMPVTQRHHRLLIPSIIPLSVSRRAVIQGEYRRPGKPKEYKYPWQRIKFDLNKGLEGIRKNITLLKEEFFERLVGPQGKPILEHMLEQNRVVWEFRGPECLEQWTVSCDREIGGESDVHLKLSRNNTTCLLYGTLVSTPPKDGETRYSGYCTMRSKQPLVSLLCPITHILVSCSLIWASESSCLWKKVHAMGSKMRGALL